MAILLDTATVAECDRADLIATTLLAAVAPMHIELSNSGTEVRGQIEGWQYGSATLLRVRTAGYLAHMIDTADTPAGADLGAGCVDVVRALILSAATSTSDGAALPADILLTQIRDYIRKNLADPDLSPANIARAHHISVRYLYKLCAQANFSLREWTIAERLHHIRRDLTDPHHRHRTIATIAQHNGFRDPSHFTRRFRTAFGMTPHEWRNTFATESDPISDEPTSTEHRQ